MCKGGFSSEAARRRVGLGKHPTSGHPLKGWSKVGDGTEGLHEGFLLGVPLRNLTKGKEEKEDVWDLAQGEKAGSKGEEEFGEEDLDDWGLWMDRGQDHDEEEHHGEGFLGFDDP
jgi:hypothetical protein